MLTSSEVIVTNTELEAEMLGSGAKWGLRHRNVLCSLKTDGRLPSPFQPLTRSPRPLLEVDAGLQPHPAEQAERQECCSAQLFGQGRLFIL